MKLEAVANNVDKFVKKNFLYCIGIQLLFKIGYVVVHIRMFKSMVRTTCRFFLLFALVVSSKWMYGQGNCSYVVVSLGGYTQLQVDQAFANADLDAYRMKTARRPMLFANGAQVELLSATEMQASHCPVNSALAMEDNVALDPNRRFDIHASGVIVELVQAVYKR